MDNGFASHWSVGGYEVTCVNVLTAKQVATTPAFGLFGLVPQQLWKYQNIH